MGFISPMTKSNGFKQKRVLVLSALLIGSVAIILGNEILHDIKIRQSDFRYTVVTVVGNYFKGEVIGKEFEYSLNGIRYNMNCSSQECKYSGIGSRFIIKVYLSDPEFFEIVFSQEVPKEIFPPSSGWERIPDSVKAWN